MLKGIDWDAVTIDIIAMEEAPDGAAARILTGALNYRRSDYMYVANSALLVGNYIYIRPNFLLGIEKKGHALLKYTVPLNGS